MFQILRSLFVSDRKRALAKGLREATPYSEDEIPDDIDIEYNLNAPLEMHPSGGAEQHTFRQLTSQPLPKSLEEEMADELARREEEELAAYAEMMEVPHQTQARDFAEEMMEVQEQRRYNSDDDYGWDDDMDMEGYEMDMDESMMEVGDGIVMSQQSQQLDMSQQSLQPTHHTEDSMDMS